MSGFMRSPGLLRVEPDLQRARHRIDLRLDVGDLGARAAVCRRSGRSRTRRRPTLIDVMSDSKTSAMIQTRLRSVIVYRSLSGVTF